MTWAPGRIIQNPKSKIQNSRGTHRCVGQVMLEYAVWLAVVVAAIIAMEIYIKRGVQGGYRGAADAFGRQYAPGCTISIWTTDVRGTSVTSSTFKANQTVMVNNAPRVVDIMAATTYIGASNNGVIVPGNQSTQTVGQETVWTPTGTNLWNN